MQKGLWEQGRQPAAFVPLAAVQNNPYTISINTEVFSGVSQCKPQQMLDAIISSCLFICCSSVSFSFPLPPPPPPPPPPLATCLYTDQKSFLKKYNHTCWSLYHCPKLMGQEKKENQILSTALFVTLKGQLEFISASPKQRAKLLSWPFQEAKLYMYQHSPMSLFMLPSKLLVVM